MIPKRIRLCGVLVLALFAAGSVVGAQAQGQIKIGIIDLKKVFDGYYRTKQADTQLKDRAADFEKARQGMLDDYEQAKSAFEKLRDGANDQALAADERESRKAAAEKKLVELRQIEQDVAGFDRTSRTTLQEQMRRMRERIVDEIKEVVASKAKQAGLALVLDTAAQTADQTPVVMYSNGENDITEVVLNELNSRGPVELPDPAKGSKP